jgi:DNA invertase Pin-like site-specific DNA recombinase
MTALYSPKINPEHLARKAIVYLRQSSDKQVRQNKESQRLQYDVAERIRALGWKQVEIIDGDLGSSAAMAAARREGFERVLSSVALGEVGIIGSREVSRLSRTDKDWCRLLEVCQIFGTLIADEQQVYDLNYLDDQLVLGIKGTLSVVELKVLRQRLQAGQESKARRGELFKRLPVGYVRDSIGKVVFHPDQRVCEAIQLVFAKFRERWSVRQTFQWFRDHDIELPANPIQGTQLVWKIPSQSLVRDRSTSRAAHLYHRVLSYSGTFVNQQWPANLESPHCAWEFHASIIPNSPVKPIRIWMEVGDKDLLISNDGYHDWVNRQREHGEGPRREGLPLSILVRQERWSRRQGHEGANAARSARVRLAGVSHQREKIARRF